MSLDVTTLALAKSYTDQHGGGDGGGTSVPKPLTYDYMPEGYPTKSIGTVTLMEEQEVTFQNIDGTLQVIAPVVIEVSDGQTYTIVWDGVEYSCVCHVMGPITYIGNPAAFGLEATSEPFLYVNSEQSIWVAYDTSTSHTIKVTTISTVYQTIDVNMLPKAGENYGIVKKGEIVTAYNFPIQAPHDQMVDAIAAFNTGNASIVWHGKKVINASYESSDDTISVAFAPMPLKTMTFSNDNGIYKITVGKSTYGELQGNGVRIVNDNNGYTVLSVKGEPGSETLNVTAERISIGGIYGISTTEMILKSSTVGSNKYFKITVDDNGTISVTDVTA